MARAVRCVAPVCADGTALAVVFGVTTVLSIVLSVVNQPHGVASRMQDVLVRPPSLGVSQELVHAVLALVAHVIGLLIGAVYSGQYFDGRRYTPCYVGVKCHFRDCLLAATVGHRHGP